MTNQTFPITPPPEALQQWRHQWACCPQNRDPNLGSYIANQASHWGWDQRGAATEAELQQAADQELEACLERILDVELADQLRAARRPKPSLKEQALETLHSMQIEPCVINGVNTNADLMAKYDILRRALEALPND